MGSLKLRYLAYSLLLPVAALTLLVGVRWLGNFGTSAVSTSSGLFMGVAYLAAFGMVFFSQDGTFELNPVLGFLALIAFCLTLGGAHETVDRFAFHQRGVTTSCDIVELDQRVVRNDSGETTTYQTYYDHTLACAAEQVAAMTTEDDPAGTVGERIPVVYDPAGRLSPRPADAAADYVTMLLLTALAFTAGVGLVLGSLVERFNDATYRLLGRVLAAVSDAGVTVVGWWRDRRARRRR